MMITLSTFFFTLLHISLWIGVALWFIRTQVRPFIRASFTQHATVIHDTQQSITQLIDTVRTADDEYMQQELECARLTRCMEQWQATMAQQTAATEQEMLSLTSRFQDRCAENIRIKGQQRAERIIVKNALKQARIQLTQQYASPHTQRDYLDTRCNTLNERYPHVQ